ncbi:MAG TPA: TIGR03668 family PPOX class F420-dependent oxidoreductase [Actinomycetota bacterium]|nr:TIGR03668 family PPOX class F420-dependent oxidoreductase [Actinomycetota bacterium]
MPSLTEEVCRRLLGETRVGVIATVDPDGRPNVVPFVFALDGDTLYSTVDRKPKSTTQLRRVENIRARPDQVTVLVDHYEEVWNRVWWVRLRGRGRVIDGGPDLERAVALLQAKYEQHRDSAPQGPAILIDITEWRGWSFRPIE